MSVSEQELESHETSHLISADKVEGTPVKNSDGDKLGTIDKVMIDKRSGKVAYAVMSFGGFLGMGESRHPLPWHVLTYDTDLDGYVVDIDKDKLRNAPHFEPDEDVAWGNEAWHRRVHDYYGVQPYWTAP